MNLNKDRYTINSLIQLAKITENQDLRETLISEAIELLDGDLEYGESIFDFSFDEDAISKIKAYLNDKYRVCPIEIWREALGKKGKPKKYQSREIISLVLTIPGWFKIDYATRFGKYGNQRGLQKRVDNRR